mgnify:CR=1 FL=1
MPHLNLKEHLSRLLNRFEEVEAMLADPKVIADTLRFRALSSEYTRQQSDMAKVRHYLKLLQSKQEAAELLASSSADADLRALAEEELAQADAEIEASTFEMEALLIEPDANEGRNVIVEIRAGTGGEEAALFVGDLFKMYARLCESQGLYLEVLSEAESDLGGYKEIIFSVEGSSAWRLFHNEGGAHRVQRIPTTESQGRIHTSAVTVAVLPEAADDEIEIDEKDLRVDVYRASGAGGQHVNKTESAVRLTHIPTGLVVTCQDERSQHKNRAKAMKVLRSRLKQLEEDTRHQEMASLKKSQVKSGDRSERIRTYNFPQGRVTDHRVGVTLYNLADFMQGEMTEILDALIEHEKKEQLEAIRKKEIG